MVVTIFHFFNLTYKNIKLILRHWMIRRTALDPPADLLIRRLDQLLEADILEHFDAEEERRLQQDALQLADADVVDGAGAELAVELLGAQTAQVRDVVGPEVQHIVSREPVSLLHNDHPGAEQLGLDGRAEAAGARADHQHILPRAHFPALVHFEAGALVELGPQRLGLPRAQLGLEPRVEVGEVSGLEPQHLAEVPETPEDGFERGGVDKVVEDLVGEGGVDGDALGPAAVGAGGGARTAGQRGRRAATGRVSHD